MQNDDLKTLAAAADALQLAPSTLRRWLRRGRIQGHTLDVDPWSDVLDFTTARPTTYFRIREVLAQVSR